MQENNYIGISEDKLHHILGVARRCYEIAKEREYSEEDARRLFMIGWIHDVGYEFSERFEEHPKISDNMISTLVKHGNFAVRNHGSVDLGYSDRELEILNIADLTVDHKGNKCTIEERLKGIEDRFGKDTDSYKNAKKLAKQLGLLNNNEKYIEHSILLDENIEQNSYGVNKKIKANILSDEKMREIGFTDYAKDRWYFCRCIEFPNTKEYRNFEVSFSVTVPKDGSEIRIDVLDEAFCQPYDYQSMIIHNRKLGIRPNKTCITVFEQVEKWMKYLHEHGVLEGHIYGEYI